MTTEINTILNDFIIPHFPGGMFYQRLQRLKATAKRENSELEEIYNLSESHSPGLRLKTVLNYENVNKKIDETNQTPPQTASKEALMLKCPQEPDQSKIKDMLRYVEEMPEEWTIVQLTPEYNPLDEFNEDNDTFYTNPIHISVFSCGKNQPKPFLVTAKAPVDPVNGAPIQLAKEMADIIVGNKESLKRLTQHTVFQSQKEKIIYFSRRQFIEDRLKSLITDIQNLWLKEWRCLLTGKFCYKNLENIAVTEIRNFFEGMPEIKITEKILKILISVAKCSLKLKLAEVKSAVQYCFPDIAENTKIISIVKFLRDLGDNMTSKYETTKHPVILVLHDTLDFFPWEMIDVLQGEPVSRSPSLHFVYSLFEEHKNDIVGGYKILTDYDKGTYVVNPDLDLHSMETRMTTFFNYWTPNWRGSSGCRPKKDEFLELLTSSDIFSYNGHGSGSHLISMEKVQRQHIKAVVLLFGCGSTKLKQLDPQVEMYGPYHMYLIARCPCVVGMLWEVADLDTDTLTTDFISYWIPSKAPIHWKYVEKTKWKKAEEKKIEFVRRGNPKTNDDRTHWEPELLRALCLAKSGASYLGTKAACVARGLPVKIQIKS